MKKKISKRQKKWIERTVDNDRTYKLLLYNRFYIYALLVLFQIAGWALFLVLLTYNSAWAFSVQILTGALALISILYIINRHERPSLKLGWILVILIAPVFGVPLYLTCGEGRQTRRMQKKIDEAKAENEARAREVLKGDEPKLPQEREEGISYYLSKYAGYPAYTDGEVTYYESGEKMFPAIKEALEEAKKFILVEYFIIAHGKMWGDILKKRKRGYRYAFSTMISGV